MFKTFLTLILIACLVYCLFGCATSPEKEAARIEWDIKFNEPYCSNNVYDCSEHSKKAKCMALLKGFDAEYITQNDGEKNHSCLELSKDGWTGRILCKNGWKEGWIDA